MSDSLDTKSSNKRIAKNTMFLYMRMFVSIIVNLYTVRVLWQVLGIDDYGIYNVVGGIVLMFAFLNNAMIASSQRFISFELGKGNKERLIKTFSISITVHLILALCVLILAETIGVWFLNEKLNIPSTRMAAANWVYQCSVISFLLNVISVPYNACIVAHEHMKVYGYFGIIDIIIKLFLVLLTAVIPFDHLITYAILILLLSASMRFAYSIYCKTHFEECRFHRSKDKRLMKDMFSFAGWSFIGNMGFSVRDQGINIILNLFFNVAVNAAKGIATQVGTVINGFATNFTMALNPQITKRYASGDIDGMLQLLYNGCKFSLILMSIVVIPLIMSAKTILSFWLGDVAPYTVGFLQLALIISIIDCVVSPITTSLQATGRIKKFQIIISIIMLANLPISWIWLKLDANPYIVMVVSIATSIIALISRLVLLHELINFSYRCFFYKVYSRTIPYLFISSIWAWILFPIFDSNFIGIILYIIFSLIGIGIALYLIALNKSKKKVFVESIVSRLKILKR